MSEYANETAVFFDDILDLAKNYERIRRIGEDLESRLAKLEDLNRRRS